MGRFYDMFYKREPVQDVVHVTLPPGFATPHGYGALMSIDFAACEQTKARSMASLPFSVMQAGRDGHKRLDNHPLAKILNGMANEEMTAAKLMGLDRAAPRHLRQRLLVRRVVQGQAGGDLAHHGQRDARLRQVRAQGQAHALLRLPR